jgi:AmmeMemoRadiSam system protein A
MDELGNALLRHARAAIAEALGEPVPAAPDLAALHDPGASFVTLTQGGELRGCIGSLEAHRPLLDDVRANARAAALRDPRFPPLVASELARTRVEVSLLTLAEPLPVSSEADACRQLRPGVDGVILSAGGRRATFLPQVWEQLPEPANFLARLRQKAGLPANYWGPDVRLARYAVRKWKEDPC